MPIIMDNTPIETLMMDGTEILTATMDGTTVYQKINVPLNIASQGWISGGTTQQRTYRVTLSSVPAGVPTVFDSESRIKVTFTVTYTNPAGNTGQISARIDEDIIFVPTGQEEVNVIIAGSLGIGFDINFEIYMTWNLNNITGVTINSITFFG